MTVARTVLLEALLTPPKPTQRVEMQRIDFGPGQKSPLHMHPCPVVGIVLKGSVFFEVEGRAASVLKEGDAFLEPAGVRVPHFDNASGTEGMSFIACYLLERKGEEKLVILT